MTSKTSVTPLPVNQWHQSLAGISQDMKGHPINVHKLMAHHPALLKAWWNFRNYSVAGGDLGSRKGELVILRTAVHLRAWYEWGSHVQRGLACGLTMDEIERVKQGSQAAGWSAEESCLLKAVDQLFFDNGLSKELETNLREHFSLQQIMDIVAIHGMYVILGEMINTWGLELDEHVRTSLPEGVTKEKFEQEFSRG